MRYPFVALVLALTLAACGSSGGDEGKIATAGGSATASTAPKAGESEDAIFAYARCMREHGVPMPDPTQNSGGGMSFSMPQGTDPAKGEVADKECKKLLPNGGEPVKPPVEELEAQRKLAKCMRENGLPTFPDPDPSGGTRIEGSKELDPMSEKYKAAEKACAKFAPKGGSVHSESEK